MPRGQRDPRSYVLIGAVLLLFTGSLVGAGLLGQQALLGSAIRTYYVDTYSPLSLIPSKVESPPTEARLADVPWYSTGVRRGPVTSLRMVAAQSGITATDAEISFLMGYTFGARKLPGLVLSPFGDPEAGHVAAAPALGLRRGYYTADDADAYLRAVRLEISRGRPVYVTLDRAVLTGEKGPIPHGVLFVGYDAGSLYYFETTCAAPSPCVAADRPPGERGLPLAGSRLLAAVEAQSKIAEYPWRFAYSTFEAAPTARDDGATIRRNGQLLAGQFRTGPIQGAAAVEAIANLIPRAEGRADLGAVRAGLAGAAPARRDSASYLRSTFPNDAVAKGAAEQLERSAASYEAALAALGGDAASPRLDEAAKRMQEAASADRAAGTALLAHR